jgi:hypothetical protein
MADNHRTGRDTDMKLDEIKEIAKQHNIKAGKMKKSDLVRAIQQAEGNEVCFDTGKDIRSLQSLEATLVVSTCRPSETFPTAHLP